MADALDTLFDSQQPKPATLVPQTGGRDVIDSLLDQQLDLQRQQLKGVLDVVSPVNPDEAAESLKLSRSSGLPEQTVQDNLAEVRRKERVRLLDTQRVLTQSPVLARQLLDPNFAKIAHDDVEHTSAIERAYNYMTGLPGGKESTLLGDLSAGAYEASRGAAGMFQAGAEAVAPIFDPLTGTILPENPLRRTAEGFANLGARAKATADYLSPPSNDVIGGGVSSGIKSLSQNLLGLPMAFFPGGQAAYMTYLAGGAGGQSYQDAREKGLSTPTSLVFGASQGLIEYATEKLPVGQLLGDIKAGAPIWKTLAHQLALEMPGEQVATVLQDLNEWAVLHPERPFSDYLAERPSAALQTAIATVIGVGGNVAVGKVLEKAFGVDGIKAQEARRADGVFNTLSQLSELSAASKVRERDVQSFETFMQAVESDTGGSVNTLYIEPKTLVETLEAAGANIAEVQAALPSLSNLDEQLRTGTMVAIPVSEFTARISGEDYAQSLLPHLKTDPNGMNKVEADEYMKTQGDQLKAEVEKVLAEKQGDDTFKASMEKVKSDVKAQLEQTQRFTSDVNEAYSTLMSTFYAVTGAKIGMTPEQMAAKYPIKISAESVAGMNEYDQAGNLKTETPQFKQFFGSSQVVDKAGKPLVVYHGTDSNVSVFRGGEEGIFFAESPDTAKTYGEKTVAAYLSIKSPLRMTWREWLQGKTDDGINHYLEGNEGLAERGYDGVILTNPDKSDPAMSSTTYIAFRPEQIKSATGNNGEYDPNNPNILNQDSEQAQPNAEVDAKEDAQSDDVAEITQGDVPESVDAASVLDNALKIAKSQVWAKGRDLKLAIQEAVQQAAKAAGVDVGAPSPQSTQYLVRAGVKDALLALQQNANAIGWYDVKTRQALSVMALVHPEIANDQNARFAFVWALAVTSNGMKVGKNFELAEQAYEAYKRDGKMPTNIQAGQAQKAINESLDLFNELVQTWGIDDLRRFMLTNFTVGEIASISKQLKPGGEHAATFVKGAAILGPKIGNGFFSNLYGNFDQLTMDRWLVRTWGRWTGTLIKPMPKQTQAARERLTAARDAVAGDARLEGIIGAPITKETPVDELALKIQEASTDPLLRAQMNESETGLELRKAGNSLAKYLDGQKEAPAGPNERNYIRQVFSEMLGELQQRPEYQDLTMADLQAVLWYAEKRLYETAKEENDEEDATGGYNDEDAPDYANAAADVARAKGVSDRKIQNALKKEEQNGRTGNARSADGQQAQAGGQQDPASGFTRSQKRLFIGTQAVHRVRSNRAGGEGQSFAYARKSSGDGGEAGLLKPRSKKSLGVTFTAEWKPGRSLGTIFRANGITTPTFLELAQGDEKNAQRFADAITDSKKASGAVGAAVYVYPAQDYQGMRLFLAEDGKSGVAIKPDGDIVSVFSNGGAGRSVMELAIAAGGTKLDAFDTILPQFYSAHGFVATSRLTWDDSQAPDGWDKQAMADFNGGQPDVVFMVLDNAYQGMYTRKDGKRFEGEDGYDKAASAQARAQKKLRATNAQYNQNEQGPRGKISFGNDITQQASVITLMKSANLSTFLHESGHFFLEVTADIAAQPDAPAEIAQDMQKILDWFGVENLQTWRGMDIEEKRPYHEKFARGFEAYLFEGKSPSMELQGIFQRFRSWLVNIYKQLTALNVEIDDEIRGVFDRMLASSDAIKQAEQARSYVPLFTTKPPFMTDEEWRAYQQSDMQASQDAVQNLEQRSLRDMQWVTNAKARIIKALQKENAEKRKEVRREVSDEVMAEPVYRAREFFKRGTLDGETVDTPVKLSIPEIEAMYGDNPILGMIKKELGFGKYGMLGTENGMHPEQAAEMFGFTSGDHMIRALLEAPDPRGVIEQRTDQRMLERYGDINSPQALARAADEAIHNEARGKFVATEANALAKATGRPKILASAAKQFAEQIINRLKIRDIRPGQYAASAARAAKNAAKPGIDLVEAATEKRNQVINTYAAKAAFNAQDEVIKAVRYLTRFDSKNITKTVHIDYLEQIWNLLDRFDLRTSTTLKDIDQRRSLVAWVQSQQEKGEEPVIPEKLLNEAYRVSYKEMTLEDFRGLVDAVRNIEHLGRLKDKLLKIQDQREFKAVVADASETIRENATKDIQQQLEKKGLKDAVVSGGREVFAWHRKFASLIRQMDGFKDGGTLWEIFSRPMNEAANKEASMREQATVRLAELYKGLGKVNLNQKMFIPEIGGSLSLEGRLAVALNMGNETNMRRVMEGEGWNAGQVNAVVGSLTREQWTFVQNVWDMLNSYWPDIAAKERRMTGLVPEKVQSRAFMVTLADGTQMNLEGGYYPIKYNANRSSKAEADTAAEVLKQMERGLYARAQTARGHLESRVQSVGRPMRYDLGVIDQHLNQVIHDLSWHEYLVDANRLLRADAIDSAIRDHYGPEVLRTMRGMLEDIAIGELAAQGVIENAVRWVRSGSSIAAMGWSFMTAVQQPLGLSQSVVRIGPKWVAQGMSRWLRDAASMENTVSWISGKSEFMRLRAKTQQREIAEIRNTIYKGETMSAVQGSFFYLISKLQLVADVPTWLGMYEKAMANGSDEARAIALADQAVLDSQGGGQIKDLAKIQRGGEWQKLWTNFYSYFSVTYNLLADSVNETRKVGASRLPLLAADFLMLTVVPATLGVLLKSLVRGDDDNEDKLAKKLVAENVSYLLGLMVGTREIGAAVSGSMGYEGPAGARFFADIGKFAKQVEQGEADEAFWRSANELGGVVFHYPASQIDRTVRGIYELSEGRSNNPLAILAGPPPKN